jgi:predicted DCC family thiol-disulfide oxidoreductase YuxK
MSRYDAVLIYDGECPYCSVAAVALKRTQGIGVVSWYDDAAQAFLAGQFEDAPFAMVLADVRRRRVYAGEAAAKELSDRAGMPGAFGDALSANYDTIADVVGRLSGRGRDPDPVDGRYPMADAARATFTDLASVATDRPPEESGSETNPGDASASD